MLRVAITLPPRLRPRWDSNPYFAACCHYTTTGHRSHDFRFWCWVNYSHHHILIHSKYWSFQPCQYMFGYTNMLEYGVWLFTTPEPCSTAIALFLVLSFDIDLCGDPVRSHYTFTIFKHTNDAIRWEPSRLRIRYYGADPHQCVWIWCLSIPNRMNC